MRCALPDFAGLDVALIGVPMDLGVTNRAGARFGPRAVRGVERIGPYEHVLRIAPMPASKSPTSATYRCRAASASTSATPTSRPSSRSCAQRTSSRSRSAATTRSPPDPEGASGATARSAWCTSTRTATRPAIRGPKFHHGGPFRQAVLAGVLDPERTIQIGIRGGAEYLWEFSYDSGMTVLHAEDVMRWACRPSSRMARAVLGDGPTYVSFDIDSIDPGFAPGTGTPEVGGLTPREVLALMRGLAGLDIVGGDVVEVAPQYDARPTPRRSPRRCCSSSSASSPCGAGQEGFAGRRRRR